MTNNPTVQAVHVLLDMIAAFDDQASEEQNSRATQTAFQRFNEVDAINCNPR